MANENTDAAILQGGNSNPYGDTPGDYAWVQSLFSKLNPTAGEAAPAMWQNRTATYDTNSGADYNNPRQIQYGAINPVSANDPNTVYGRNFYSLGGSKSQGPQWNQFSGKKYDTGQVAWDPNYGWITPYSNIQEKAQQGEWIPSALQAGAGLGMSMLGVPAWAMMLTSGAQGLGNGAGLGKTALGMLPGLLGAGLGGNLNLPPEVMQYLQYLKTGYGGYNAVKNRNPGGIIGTLGQVAGG